MTESQETSLKPMADALKSLKAGQSIVFARVVGSEALSIRVLSAGRTIYATRIEQDILCGHLLEVFSDTAMHMLTALNRGG